VRVEQVLVARGLIVEKGTARTRNAAIVMADQSHDLPTDATSPLTGSGGSGLQLVTEIGKRIVVGTDMATGSVIGIGIASATEIVRSEIVTGRGRRTEGTANENETEREVIVTGIVGTRKTATGKAGKIERHLAVAICRRQQMIVHFPVAPIYLDIGIHRRAKKFP